MANEKLSCKGSGAPGADCSITSRKCTLHRPSPDSLTLIALNVLLYMVHPLGCSCGKDGDSITHAHPTTPRCRRIAGDSGTATSGCGAAAYWCACRLCSTPR